MERTASDSFSLNISVMKIIGLYPSNTYKRLHRVYAIAVYVLALIPVTVLGVLRFVFTKDFTNFDYNDFVMVGMVFYTFKFLPFLLKRRKIKCCIHYFDASDYTTENSAEKKIIENCVSVCRKISKLFFVSCIGGLTGFFGQLSLQNFQRLPLNVWLPKFVREKPSLYWTVYILLSWGAVYVVLACGTVDPLIGGLAHHATTQLQVLKHVLQHLDRHLENKNMTENYEWHFIKSENIYSEIKKCVRRYQDILDFVDEYQSCFSPVVFSQFLSSGVVIGLCCFEISKMLSVDINLFIMANYLSALFFQIFFYCYFGTLLVEENNTLCTAVYMSQWYQYNTRAKYALIILMERSKQQLVVKAGKLFELTLETFTTILKRSYSLLAVLRNY